MIDEYKKSAEKILAEEVEKDFLKRQEERRTLERNWQLNMYFLNGNQYCDVNLQGEIYEEEKKYFWQTRRVFNHIAPTMDLRLSKLGRIRPKLTVRPASDEESDKHAASLASKIIAAVFEDGDMDGVISDATKWSETCGSAFYKIAWDGNGGKVVGTAEGGGSIKNGDVKITAVSPFEIYPYSLSEEKLEAQPSIIHAKAVSVKDIYSMYGVKLAGRDISEVGSPFMPSVKSAKEAEKTDEKESFKEGYELLIERYQKCSQDLPDGRLTVVAGGILLYDGSLPYVNGDGDTREYPFVKQDSVSVAGKFFGESLITRLIPVQRAYNAVKNRKHEFLNRISMGTVAVEDGSVDIDEIIEDGLTPGKIIVYRQGAKPPETIDFGEVPASFEDEEERLLSEFSKIAGTSDFKDKTQSFASVTSATGLQLILDQDEAKLEASYGQIKRAVKKAGRQVLRLYRQFATDVRLLKSAGANNVLNIYYFKGNDISSDDVILEADNESNLSPSQRRNAVYEILDRGLFADESGHIPPSVKNKILELLGYEGFAGARDLGELNRARAGEENLALKSGDREVKSYDDDGVHITEHKAFLLTEKLTKEQEMRICAHIALHEKKLKEKVENE